ncbi:MAG: ATP-binding cassette domain-containing protein [Nitrospiraceae bacterium]|nr:ATP-binding cassette domain-containing protein [Nitrospiraceae bacterium]
MIRFEEVNFAYGARSVLRSVSLSVGFHERVAVLGGSGEGKTTILKLILGLIRPDTGSIIIDGDDITRRSESELRETRMKFSIVFQEGALFDSLDVKENVAFCLREYTDMSEDEINARVRHILASVGVEQALELMPEELSGGMHRRVSIARSLALDTPRMFLYDEPTTGLDPVNADNICGLIAELSKNGKGFIMVTHKVSDALKVADRFIFLRNGSLLFDGNRHELLNSDHPDIMIFINEVCIQGPSGA